MRGREREGGRGQTVSTTYSAEREDFSVAAQNSKLPVNSASLPLSRLHNMNLARLIFYCI